MAKLILALDRSFTPYNLNTVDGIKLNVMAFFNGWYEYIQNIKYNKEVFLDLKIADISYGNLQGTNYKIVESINKNNDIVNYVNIHGFMGRNAIREAVQAGYPNLKILVLCSMTDPTYSNYFNIEHTRKFVNYAKNENAYGLILPGNNLKLIDVIKQEYSDLPIWSPGFGRQNKWGDIYEQLEIWRNIVGSNPEHAAIIGSHLLECLDMEREIEIIKEIIK